MKKIIFILLVTCINSLHAATYYIRPSGKNSNNGTAATSAWLDLTNVNNKVFVAGDIINLEQSFTYFGKIYFDGADGGTAQNPVILTSWNSKGALTGRATINAGSQTAIFAYNTAGFKISDLNIYGTNLTGDGISFYNDLPNNVKKDFLLIQNIEVIGFKNGVSIGSWNQNAGYSNVTLVNIDSHDNLNSGIVTYSQGKLGHTKFEVRYCKAYNNFGDINNTATNTGSGIVLSGVDGGNINHCLAFNNGQNNGRIGGGPVGIWCYEANNVTIEYNESYNNKAGKDTDGGGFDIDGGSTNCIMQYNYSHDNEGPGFLFAQYSGATAMDNNTARYNISENDARKNSTGSIVIYSAPGFRMSNTQIYGNTIFLSPAASGTSSLFQIYNGTNTSATSINNNIFITTNGIKLIDAGSTLGIMFQNNNYWSSGSAFSINWSNQTYTSLADFKSSGQEFNAGLQVDPQLVSPNAGITLNNTDLLSSLTAYQLKSSSPMINAGISISNSGTRDFYGNNIPLDGKYDIGASEFKASDIEAPNSPVLSLIGKSTNLVSLAWTTPTDNVGVVGYNVFNGLTKVNATTILGNSYVVTGLSINTNYDFTVKAIDAAANISNASKVLSVTLNLITGVEKNNFENNSIIFPNPTTGLVNIYVDNDNQGILKLKIFNQVGEEVYQFADSKNQKMFTIDFNLNSLPSGLYYVDIQNDNFKTVKKIIKY